MDTPYICTSTELWNVFLCAHLYQFRVELKSEIRYARKRLLSKTQKYNKIR